MEELEPVVAVKKVISPAIILPIIAVIIVAVIIFASRKESEVPAVAEKAATTTVADNDTSASGQAEADNDEDNAGTVPAPTPTPVVSTKTTPTTTTQTNTTFANGTYSAVGNYYSPEGSEQINVTLTLKDGVVTASTVTAMATQRYSLTMQNDFIANYKTLVIGKKITDIKLGKVSGASLTPIGFNDAVAKIEAQAKV